MSRKNTCLNFCVKVPAILNGQPTTADFEDIEVVVDFTRTRRNYPESPTEIDDEIDDIAVNRDTVEANLRSYLDEGYEISETVEQIMQRAENMARNAELE